MAIFHVDSDAVHHASSQAQHSISRIQAEVQGLHAQLSSLQGSWQGVAADAFQSVVTQWHQTAHRVDESLNSISHALSLAASQYGELEQSTARMFRG